MTSIFYAFRIVEICIKEANFISLYNDQDREMQIIGILCMIKEKKNYWDGMDNINKDLLYCIYIFG